MRINALDVKGALDKNQQLISAVTIVATQTKMNVFGSCFSLYFRLQLLWCSVEKAIGSLSKSFCIFVVVHEA